MEQPAAPSAAVRGRTMAAVDAHQHFWDTRRVTLPWLTAEHARIAGPFEPADLKPLMIRAGVERTVLVQSACSDEDTDLMLEHAAAHDWIGAVVAWVDLQTPARAAARLDELAAEPRVRGIRHLIHDEEDAHWILRPAVLETLALLEERGLLLELPAVWPCHLGDVPELARAFPRLTIVIDHLGKPPLGRDDFPAWAAELGAAASFPNVHAKVSGLNTALDRPDWSADDLRPAVEVARDAFGPSRLLCGSDWPVALLNGDYERVWSETRRVLELVAPDGAAEMLAGTARRLYALDQAGPEGNAYSSSDSGSSSTE
jgi:L-fuconolactonase